MSRRRNPLWQLFLVRVRATIREPSAVFWVFAFPLLTSLALGIAFRNTGPKEFAVVVAAGEDAAAVSQHLDAVEGLSSSVAELTAARELIRRGKVALVVLPAAAGTPTPTFFADATHPDSRPAELLVRDALERRAGREDRLTVSREQVEAKGARYIDFLIPGLLGLGLMSSSIWGLAWALVQMRTAKLLKRLVASPMQRRDFLLSFLMGRSVLALVETGFFVLFARLVFDVEMAGNTGAFFAIAMLGALTFGGMAILVASRAQNSETASGLMNLVTMPMMVMSGVFFSASNFPAFLQPFISLLPLTALNDGLRAVMQDGRPLTALGPQLLVLGVWGVGSFVVGLKLFRWT